MSQLIHTHAQDVVREHLDHLHEHQDTLSRAQKDQLRARIKDLLKREDAVLVAHYYTDAELQSLAEETGGCVSDSLEMARFGNAHPAKTLVVAGVKFMGETAKILGSLTGLSAPGAALAQQGTTLAGAAGTEVRLVDASRPGRTCRKPRS